MGSLVSSEFWESSVCARPLGKAHATQYSRSSGKPLPRSAWRLPWLPRSWGKRSTVFEMLLQILARASHINQHPASVDPCDSFYLGELSEFHGSQVVFCKVHAKHLRACFTGSF